MQFEKLANQIYKKSRTWNIKDVQKWLKHINLSQLSDRFKQQSIDGSCLNLLTQDQLRQQLKIKSSITINKIMKWIISELKNYDLFLDLKYRQNGNIKKPQQYQIPTTQNKNKNDSKLMLFNNQTKKCLSIQHEEVIIDYCSSYRMFQNFKYIKIPYQFTVISKIKDNYYLNPQYSDNSTYILLEKPILVYHLMQINIGKDIFQTHLIQQQLCLLLNKKMKKKFHITHSNHIIYQDPITGLFSLKLRSGIQVLRITKNMSQFWIESISAKVWLNIQKKKFKIRQDTIFKIGKSQAQYHCNFYKNNIQSKKPKGLLCFLCWQRQYSVLLECRHVLCMTCTKKIYQQEYSACPFCREQIINFTRIHHT